GSRCGRGRVDLALEGGPPALATGAAAGLAWLDFAERNADGLLAANPVGPPAIRRLCHLLLRGRLRVERTARLATGLDWPGPGPGGHPRHGTRPALRRAGTNPTRFRKSASRESRPIRHSGVPAKNPQRPHFRDLHLSQCARGRNSAALAGDPGGSPAG